MKRVPARGIHFRVDAQLYPLEAVEAACQGFVERAYVRLSRDGGRIAVRLSPKMAMAREGLEALEGEFHNELLHQALRLRVSEANRKIREFIVTKALVSAQPASQLPAPVEPPREGPRAPEQKPGVVDEELEKEIDKLLAEIDKADAGSDPLGIAVPWEERHGGGSCGKARGPVGRRGQKRP